MDGAISNGVDGPVKPAFDTLSAADGTLLRHGHWRPASEPLATAVVLNGRTEFLEKYAETAGALLARGFEVYSLDWRNQGLSGGRPADNRQKHHVERFDDLADDLDLFVDRVVRPDGRRPLLLLGHSMGGLVATLHLARRPALYRAAILSAPMHDLQLGAMPRWAARLLARAVCGLGLCRAYALGQGDYEYDKNGVFTPDNPITSDERRWRVHHDAFRDRPELQVGGVTWGWLRAALDVSDRVQADLPLAAVRTPVLLLSAPNDRVVRAAAHEVVAKRFAAADVRRYPESRHELLMETDAIRDRVWADIDGFLARQGLTGGQG